MVADYIQIGIVFVGMLISAMKLGTMAEDPDMPVFPAFALLLFIVLFGMETIPRLSL